MISVRDGVSTERVVRDASEILREQRGIQAGEDDDFTVLDTKQIATRSAPPRASSPCCWARSPRSACWWAASAS